MVKEVFLFLLTFLGAFPTFAQIQLEVQEASTGKAIPFVHAILDDSLHLYSDMDGHLLIPYIPQEITLRQYYYFTKTITGLDSSQHKFSLTRNALTGEMHHSDSLGLLLIKKALQQKKVNKLSSKKYTYRSYNKFTVSTEKTGTPKKIFKDLVKILSYNLDDLDSIDLFLMESVSEMYHKNFLNRKERIIGMHSTGIQLPSTYSSFIHPNPISLYKNYISIANAKYVSPLCQASFVTYAYKVVDVAPLLEDTIYTLVFYPLPGKSIGTIKGLLYLSTNGDAIKYFIATPVKQKKIKIEACQAYQKHLGMWFPSSYRTNITVDKFNVGKLKLYLSARSHIFDFNAFVLPPTQHFSEIVLEYDSLSSKMSPDVWKQFRQEELNTKDKRTFQYYDSTGIQKKQSEILKFGERLYFGVIPIGKINIDLNKVLALNYLEGLRIGVGVHTNEKFSKHLRIGGYIGSGLKDLKWKYGTDISYQFKGKWEVTPGIAFKKDIFEAGTQFFPFDFYQYSTEPLRKYRLHILDYTNELNGFIGFHPLKYLKVSSGLTLAKHFPAYDYQYSFTNSEEMTFTEYSIGFRYAFGEKYIQTPTNKIYIGTPFPILWFNFTKGVQALRGQFNYTRFDFKLQQTFKFFRFGTSGIQIIGGITMGSPPYTKLYNMRGSLRKLSVVIHNSFETMKYNEFLSDRFFAVFYSHDFGKLYTSNPNFRPNLVMVHNLGFGTLRHPDYQKMIPFKTMEKGYFESGVFLKNLLVLNFSGLKTGFGLGLFARYGSYAHSHVFDNFVFKLSTNFLL